MDNNNTLEEFLKTVDTKKYPRLKRIGQIVDSISIVALMEPYGATKTIGPYETNTIQTYSFDRLLKDLTRMKATTKAPLYIFEQHRYEDSSSTTYFVASVEDETDTQYHARVSKQMVEDSRHAETRRKQYEALKKEFG